MKSSIKCMLLAFMASISAHSQQVMSLCELYEKAEHQSREITINQLGLKAASASVEAARSELLPKVSGSLSESYIGRALLMSRGFSTGGTTDVIVPGLGPQKVSNGFQDNPHWGNMFTLQATQVIYAGGAIRAGVELAELSERMATVNLDKSRQDVRFLIAGLYLDLYKIHNQLEVITRNIMLTRKIIENMESRKRQGMVLQRDITRYELQVRNLQLAEVKLTDALDIINHQLVTTLHEPDTLVICPDIAQLDAEYESLKSLNTRDVWNEVALENNTSIRQTAIASDMADCKVKIAKSASLPSVALVAEDQFFGPFTNDLIPVNANVNTWFIGVGVKYNLSSLWSNKHHVNKAQFERLQSQEQHSLARESVENAVHASYVNFQTSFKEVETCVKQMELAEQNYDVVNKRYQNGLSLLTDMIDASNLKLSAEMDYVNARLSLLYAYYKLKYVTGTL